MGVRKRLHKVGKCAGGIIIPKPILEILGLKHGDSVDIDVVKNGDTAIIIRPVKGEEQNGH
ncbi:MAG: AbrB/MazE/SpoVT family DNA-binding domain-containing protein [Candidatus Bathyarchaeia archaeon]